MIISVSSGKGGTGKTTVSVNLALVHDNIQFLDCDVEEPNSQFFLKPKIEEVEEVFALFPEVDKNKCDYCGKCAEVCAYKAINVFKFEKSGEVLLLPHLCHNCGACTYFCPKKAIKEVKKRIGVIEKAKIGNIEYFCGRLDIGEIKTPSLIKEVKKNIKKDKITIIDSPPGASCPMVNAVKNSDFCLLVTEPTSFGLNDLEIAIEALKKMKIPFAVLINRWDNNYDFEKKLLEKNIKVIAKIPFDKEIAVAYSKGIPAINISKEYENLFKEIFKKVKTIIEEK